MRQGIDGLESPTQLLATMPMLYSTDPLAEQLCASADDVLAPIFATLDCLTAYLDPRTTPPDMLDWLAGWVGLTTVGHLETSRKREVILAGNRSVALAGDDPQRARSRRRRVREGSRGDRIGGGIRVDDSEFCA